MVRRQFVIVGLVLLASICEALAQKAVQSGTVRVAVTVQSPRTRIQNLLPQMRERIIKAATDKKRNIVGVWLAADDGSVFEAAKAANCDYLLQITVTELNEVNIGASAPDVNHTGAETGIAAAIEVTYKLQSLKTEDVVVDDRHEVQPQEYPLDQNATAFETVVSRAVDGAVSASMAKLKKKLRG